MYPIGNEKYILVVKRNQFLKIAGIRVTRAQKGF